MFSVPSVRAPIAPPSSAAQESASALHRQLHITSEPLRPGMLPLQRDVRSVVDYVLEKLVALAGDPQRQRKLEALHHTLSNSEQRLEVSAQELPLLYAFFRKAQHQLEQNLDRKKPDIETDYMLCRVLKWQFRAAVSEGKHLHLTRKLLAALAYVVAGGKRINHRHLGYNFALEQTRQLSAGPYLAADSLLEISADQRVKSTRIIAGQGRVKSTFSELGASQSQNQIGLGYVSSREYASLEHYADTRSHSVRTALSESISHTALNLPSIASVHRHLSKHRDYAARSQPYAKETLASVGLVDVELPRCSNLRAALISERGTTLNVQNKVALDFFNFLNVNTTMALTLHRGQRKKKLDILGLHHTAPNIAQQQLALLEHYAGDPVTLLNDMKNHVASSSRQFVQRISTSVLSDSRHVSALKARALLERYVLLKTQSSMDPELDNQIRALIDQHPAHLRPEALKIYKLTTPVQTLGGSAGVMASSLARTSAGITIEFSHRKLDDPHLSGDYLTIDIAPFKSPDVVKEALRRLLSSIGEQTFDWEDLIHSISQSLLDPVTPTSTQIQAKIKHGQPVVLLTRHTVNKDRNLALPDRVEQYSGVNAQSLRTRQTLHEEQLGSESLDHLLPIARRYLHTPEEQQGWDKQGWDSYVEQHAEDLQALLDTLGRQTHGTVLSAELDALKCLSPALTLAGETLAQQARIALEAPTRENRATAQEALNHLFREYLPHYEAKISEAWTLS